MKLSKSLKDAIIRAIIDDVPQINWLEQAEKALRELYEAKLPPVIKELAKSDLQDHLKVSYHSVYGGHTRVKVAIVGGDDTELSSAEVGPIKELLAHHEAQEEKLDDLRLELEISFAGINTRKQFVERFPEFEKYLPEEPEKLRGMLVTTNVVNNLVEAGWPK